MSRCPRSAATTEVATSGTEVPAVSGYNKEQLVQLLADALGIQKPHLVVDADFKKDLKAQIKELKVKRQAALDAKEKTELKRVRRKIHKLRRKLRTQAKLIKG